MRRRTVSGSQSFPIRFHPFVSIRSFPSVRFHPFVSIRSFPSVRFHPFVSIRSFPSVRATHSYSVSSIAPRMTPFNFSYLLCQISASACCFSISSLWASLVAWSCSFKVSISLRCSSPFASSLSLAMVAFLKASKSASRRWMRSSNCRMLAKAQGLEI
jgi:hypothetical protein